MSVSGFGHKKIVAPIFILVVFLSVFNFTRADDGNKITVEILPGAGLKEISQNLYQKDVIRSPFLFKVYNFFRGTRKELKPGFYELDKNMPFGKLVDALVGGPEEISVVIAPGMTLKEIDSALGRKKIISEDALTDFGVSRLKNNYPFLAQANSLEGFLLPDTYQFVQHSGAQTVAEKILDNFQNKVYIPYLQEKNRLDNNDGFFSKIIIASLLEKEVISEEEQKMAADIINRRLAVNMPLQIDASALYAECQGKFLGCSLLDRPDLSINSPFNTYKYRGLPPAPVANPGVQAIFAALHPIKNNYWYYLSDRETKKTIFSKTLREHSAMINKLALRRAAP